MIGRYFLVRPVVLPSRPVMLRAFSLTMNSEVRAFGHCLAQRLVAAADAYCCRATDQTRLVPIRAASGHLYRACFFAILRLT